MKLKLAHICLGSNAYQNMKSYNASRSGKKRREESQTLSHRSQLTGLGWAGLSLPQEASGDPPQGVDSWPARQAANTGATGCAFRKIQLKVIPTPWGSGDRRFPIPPCGRGSHHSSSLQE